MSNTLPPEGLSLEVEEAIESYLSGECELDDVSHLYDRALALHAYEVQIEARGLDLA